MGSPFSSNLVDQDAPSLVKSITTPDTQPPIIPNDVEEDNHDIEVAHMGNDPYFGIPIPEVPSDQSSSSDSIHTNVPPDHQISKHNNKWTKDHPLENIIGELARIQFHKATTTMCQALFCYYDAFLTVVEPKTYKDALTQACWIEAMQEELNEFERLEVWELVPRPDKVMVITLKWIYKVKLDELGAKLLLEWGDPKLLLVQVGSIKLAGQSSLQDSWFRDKNVIFLITSWECRSLCWRTLKQLADEIVNPDIILKASIPSKRKLDLSMGIYSRAWSTL
ncbi:retrovirus-related pol polyprotein from transposon TNT 1-94 [Tanacetum coccineum]|uniref:Retrovirus-related pol polyprotein from transposon TNT 1-94 n=1 Tax=Tanacetum coccineum TaxID=301880 RepID=A0ABQ5CVU1_9ASTR